MGDAETGRRRRISTGFRADWRGKLASFGNACSGGVSTSSTESGARSDAFEGGWFNGGWGCGFSFLTARTFRRLLRAWEYWRSRETS